METKITAGSIKRLDTQGRGLAVIATLNVIDHDRDVTLPGAFGEQMVSMVPAHQWGEAPIGKARVFERDGEALAEFELNLKTDLGRNWYEALKFDFEKPPARQQYSYGFSIAENGSERGDFQGQRVRFLKKLIVHEVSPVLLGAGRGTRTLAMKAPAGMAPEILAAYQRHVVKRYFQLRESRVRRLGL